MPRALHALDSVASGEVRLIRWTRSNKLERAGPEAGSPWELACATFASPVAPGREQHNTASRTPKTSIGSSSSAGKKCLAIVRLYRYSHFYRFRRRLDSARCAV